MKHLLALTLFIFLQYDRANCQTSQSNLVLKDVVIKEKKVKKSIAYRFWCNAEYVIEVSSSTSFIGLIVNHTATYKDYYPLSGVVYSLKNGQILPKSKLDVKLSILKLDENGKHMIYFDIPRLKTDSIAVGFKVNDCTVEKLPIPKDKVMAFTGIPFIPGKGVRIGYISEKKNIIIITKDNVGPASSSDGLTPYLILN